jgi:poly-gamma-glutamate synthesis protein (capsule biosynthesis protein)
MAHRLRVRHRRPSPDGDWGSIQDLHIRIGAGFGFGRGMRVDRKEVEANLAAVREAVASATVTVFSLHAHVQGRWLRELAQKIIDSGADVVFVHGPHRLVGIEIYKRKPILYGLGNFVFQPQWVERFPAEYYADKWLPEEATIEDARKAYAVKSPYLDRREPWESVAALLRFRDGMLRELRLLPLDLSAGQLAPAKDVPRLANSASLGKPRLAHGELARGIIARMSELSRPYGTEIRYLESESVGIVDLAAYLTDAEVTAEMDEESANTTSPQ